jgi:hypothetical protein
MSKINKFLSNWINNVNKMNNDVIMWGANFNSDNNPNAPFWEKNKSKLMVLGLFSGMTILFYFLGWVLMFRVSGIVLILFFLSNAWVFLKGLFK